MKKFLAVAVALVLWGAVPVVQAATPSMTLRGTVLEAKDVDAYTYLRVKSADGEVWAAVTKAPAKVGQAVAIDYAMVLNNFESKSLGRKFDRIIFGVLVTAPGTPGAAAPGPGMGGNPHASAPAAVGPSSGANPHAAQGADASKAAGTAADIKISKATGPNAYTVAEVVAKKGTLKDKPVVIRGRVVKFTSQVMGKNWIHLRDGSGSAADGSNDLVVTTQDSAAVGDVVTVKGTARTNIDLGSGYTYAVMVDAAALQK